MDEVTVKNKMERRLIEEKKKKKREQASRRGRMDSERSGMTDGRHKRPRSLREMMFEEDD